MKIRLISSLVAALILFFAVLMPLWFFLIALSVVMIIAIMEYFAALKNKNHIFPFGPVLAAVFIIIPIWYIVVYRSPLGNFKLQTEQLILLWIMTTVALCACTCIFTNMKYSIADVSLSVFGLIYIVIPFTLTVWIRSQYFGFYFIWLIFLGAWITDISAYFTGRLLGKRKIVPLISEKKTVEGFIGGIIGCTAVITIYGVWMQTKGINVPFTYYMILGALSGFISQLGDWFASCIKRYLRIKDFGNIMPGHGGVLDRFDSIFAVVPLVYVFIIIVL